MRKIVLLIFLALLQLTIARDYCSVCQDHTMCKFTGKNPSCGEKTQSGVTPLEAKQIVDMHNAYRAKVAKGYERRGGPGPQPPAANMRALVWDDKLAEVAQRWADQCTFQHDSCRNDPRFKVGQNIYWSSGFSSVNWTRAVDMWYNEVSRFNRRGARSFYDDSSIGHYTQMVWGNTRLIGCGRTTYGGAYRQHGYRPREFVLSASSSTPSPLIKDITIDESTRKRASRDANVGFFGGATFDPAGAKGAITGSKSDGSGSSSPTKPPTENNPSTGNRPTSPSNGNRPSSPGTGTSVNQGTENGPNYPATGTGPSFPGIGSIASWPGFGNLPFFGALGNLPFVGDFGNLPFINGLGNLPFFGSFFGGNHPNRPIYATLPVSGYPINGPTNAINWPTNFGQGYGYYPGPYGYYSTSPNQYPIYTPAYAPVGSYHDEYLDPTKLEQNENLGYLDSDKDLPSQPIVMKPEEGYLPTYDEWQQTQDNDAGLGNDEWQSINYDYVGGDQILICNYGPSANHFNQPVYIEGKACSRCPLGTICQGGLCVDIEYT